MRDHPSPGSSPKEADVCVCVCMCVRACQGGTHRLFMPAEPGQRREAELDAHLKLRGSERGSKPPNQEKYGERAKADSAGIECPALGRRRQLDSGNWQRNGEISSGDGEREGECHQPLPVPAPRGQSSLGRGNQGGDPGLPHLGSALPPGAPQGAGLGLPLRSASPPAGLCSLHEAPQTQRPYMVTEPQARQLEGTLEGHLAQQLFSNHRCF